VARQSLGQRVSHSASCHGYRASRPTIANGVIYPMSSSSSRDRLSVASRRATEVAMAHSSCELRCRVSTLFCG